VIINIIYIFNELKIKLLVKINDWVDGRRMPSA